LLCPHRFLSQKFENSQSLAAKNAAGTVSKEIRCIFLEAAMKYAYKTQGTCSRRIDFDFENGVVRNIGFKDGCDGNLKALARFAEGLTPEQIEENARELLADSEKPRVPTSSRRRSGRRRRRKKTDSRRLYRPLSPFSAISRKRNVRTK
jgi:uncharacterized protein (TIGR03905 family)